MLLRSSSKPNLPFSCPPRQVYFRINAINNCKQPLKQIETNKLFEGAKMAHKVTLRWGAQGQECYVSIEVDT
jgi:hypothetical protein